MEYKEGDRIRYLGFSDKEKYNYNRWHKGATGVVLAVEENKEERAKGIFRAFGDVYIRMDEGGYRAKTIQEEEKDQTNPAECWVSKEWIEPLAVNKVQRAVRALGEYLGESYKGSTTDFGSVNPGSSPGSPAI